MKLSDATPAVIRDIWLQKSSSISDRPYIAEVAETVIDGLYERFEESLVMARAFLTVPYQMLPERQRQFATNLARAIHLENLLGPYTPVHSLLATRGRVSGWNNPRESRGHVAIPLLSEAFVSSIPMMSRLLKDLGLPLTWVQDPGAVFERQMIGFEVGCFWVADPANAVDEFGRKVIPAQEFVTDHQVHSVFAVGGVIFGGAVLVLIFFGQDRVESRSARAFMPLINHVKGTMVSRCSISRVFRPEITRDQANTDIQGSPSIGGRH